MNTKSLLTRTIIVFAALAAAGLIMAGSAKYLQAGIDQIILVALGSALFGAALAFFLIRLFSLVEK